MRRGAWHQFGDRSQLLALEQLQHGAGVGVVISPRDLSHDRAVALIPDFQEVGADIMIDSQFHLPESTVGRLVTYEDISPFRQAASQLNGFNDSQFTALQQGLEALSQRLHVTAVIAPSVVYEAGRPDINDLNARLFTGAKAVGDSLGVPTLATIVIGSSATASDQTTEAVLADATSLPADGWYFAFETDEARIPASHSSILRHCKAGLTLACTGKPVFHAFAGPVSLLSACFGATATGIGHSQNLWQFSRERWEPSDGGGGGGNAPPRLFSTALWGTIIYEDEFALLSDELRAAVLTPSPFSSPVSATPPYLPWSRWEANKHLVYLLADHARYRLQDLDAEHACGSVIAQLQQAIELHSSIAGEGVSLGDNTNSYQNSWRAALQSLVAASANDFELLRMIRGL